MQYPVLFPSESVMIFACANPIGRFMNSFLYLSPFVCPATSPPPSANTTTPVTTAASTPTIIPAGTALNIAPNTIPSTTSTAAAMPINFCHPNFASFSICVTPPVYQHFTIHPRDFQYLSRPLLEVFRPFSLLPAQLLLSSLRHRICVLPAASLPAWPP